GPHVLERLVGALPGLLLSAVRPDPGVGLGGVGRLRPGDLRRRGVEDPDVEVALPGEAELLVEEAGWLVLLDHLEPDRGRAADLRLAEHLSERLLAEPATPVRGQRAHPADPALVAAKREQRERDGLVVLERDAGGGELDVADVDRELEPGTVELERDEVVR